MATDRSHLTSQGPTRKPPETITLWLSLWTRDEAGQLVEVAREGTGYERVPAECRILDDEGYSLDAEFIESPTVPVPKAFRRRLAVCGVSRQRDTRPFCLSDKIGPNSVGARADGYYLVVEGRVPLRVNWEV